MLLGLDSWCSRFGALAFWGFLIITTRRCKIKWHCLLCRGRRLITNSSFWLLSCPSLQWKQKRSWLTINVVWCLLELGPSQGEVCIDTLKIWACLSVLCHQLWLSVSFARSGIMELFSPLLFLNWCWPEGWEQPWLWWDEGSVLGIWKVLWCCVLNPRLKNRKSIWSSSWKVYHAPELMGTWRLLLWTLGKILAIHQHLLFAVSMRGFLGCSPSWAGTGLKF